MSNRFVPDQGTLVEVEKVKKKVMSDTKPVITSKRKLFQMEFGLLTQKMNCIVSKKNQDYTTDEDPLSNFKLAERVGVAPVVGGVIRMSDKMSRIYEYCKKWTTEVDDEKFEDTLIDLANYALITILLHREKNDEQKTIVPNCKKKKLLKKERDRLIKETMEIFNNLVFDKLGVRKEDK
ncbi:MAG: hypothetical protein DDT41_01218 [candidate division WS2 bacterium]|nr:hypothetical protein [Candidatus Psychracetigena formicireducens]